MVVPKSISKYYAMITIFANEFTFRTPESCQYCRTDLPHFLHEESHFSLLPNKLTACFLHW